MRIEAPQLTFIEDQIQISARVIVTKKRRDQPELLWFRFPKDLRHLVSLEVDPFVVALLLLAMQNNESIELEGTISEKLLLGLKKYQEIYHSWFPSRFHLIEIVAAPRILKAKDHPSPGCFACAFSGGVDSFFSFLSLYKKPIDQSTLTHALFMAGFDMPLHLGESIKELTDSYADMMQSLGIQFVAGSTNVREFVNAVDWTNAHGQALAASALFFQDQWSRFYIPSSYVASTYPKWGTHPALDPLLSTETLTILHHGDLANRVEKLNLLVKHDLTFPRLRVCWIQDIGLKNCGECEKCVRTMIGLDLLKALGSYSTFQSRLTSRKIRELKMRTRQARIFARELITEAKKRGRRDRVRDLRIALLRRLIFYKFIFPLRKLKQKIMAA